MKQIRTSKQLLEIQEEIHQQKKALLELMAEADATHRRLKELFGRADALERRVHDLAEDVQQDWERRERDLREEGGE